MRPAHDRLVIRFFFYLVTTSLITIVTLTVFFGIQLVSALSDNALRQSRQRMERIEDYFTSFITDEVQDLVAYHTVFDGSDLNRLVELIAANPRYLGSYILDRNGIVQHSSNPLQIGYRYAGRPFFRMAAAENEPLFLPRFDALSDELIIDLIIPVTLEPSGQRYIAIHELDPRWFEQSVIPQLASDEGDVLLFDDTGVIYLRMRSADVEDPWPVHRPVSLFDYEFTLERLDSAGPEFESYESGRSLVVYREMADNRLGLIANRISLRLIDEQINDVIQLAFVAAIGAFALSAVLGILMARRIIQPITDLSEQVRRTLGGFQNEIPASRHEELVPLVDALNQTWAENMSVQRSLIEQKHAAEQASAAKSQFLANMSHEIRTPLNGILGLSSLAGDDVDSERMLQRFARIEQSAKNLLRIINDILDYSKVEAGAMKIESRAFVLPELIDRVSAMFQHQVEEQQLDYTVRIDPDVPAHLSGDDFRLGQILMNLIGNAVKFTSSGGISVSVVCEHQTEHGVELLFNVTDTGIGIDPSGQKQLFAAFAQADGSVSREYGGTGLGLAITRQITSLMGGEIWLESAYGEGTQCFVRIPFRYPSAEDLRAIEQPNAATADHDTTASSADFTGACVLVVEDNAINQEIARELLVRRGATVEVVSNGVEALDALDRSAPDDETPLYDAVLMDVQMPVMDGYAATRAIRTMKDPGLRALPVIAMTAHAMSDHRDACMEAGMNDYISKPFLPEEFYRVVGKWVKPRAGTSASAPGVETANAPHAAADDSSGVAVDFQRGLSMALENEALYRQLLQMLARDVPPLIEGLMLSGESRDLSGETKDTLAGVVHSIKGMAGGIGARRLADACADLGDALQSGRATEADLLLLQQETRRVLDEVSFYLSPP